MRFTETSVPGAFLIELETIEDDRGFFARSYCANEFAEHGLDPAVAQINMSRNHKRGTLRGLHYQAAPAEEAKFIRCIQGAIYDVIVDVRPDSAAYGRWFGAELSAENGRALYVPEMCAHGYLTLTDDAAALYHASEFYAPGTERGLRYDDPALGIEWPIEPQVVSAKDRSWPGFEALEG